MLKLTHFLDAGIERVPLNIGLDWLDENYYYLNFKDLTLKEKITKIRKHNKENPLN